MLNSTASAILLISCPDRKGLVATVTDFIARHDGNILHLDQYVDGLESVFFMRVEWDLSGFTIPRAAIGDQFEAVAAQFSMAWTLHFSDVVPRMALFVSKADHCLYDILARCQAGEWPVTVPLMVSNHPELGAVARKFDVDYHVFSINAANKREQEDAQIQLLRDHQIDFIVLARYMQIVSPEFIGQYPNRIINIHHSFLPAFPGAKPYHSAYQRGVKIIGATSHYVTADLDAGPIIEQNTVRVTHRDSVEDLIRKGKDVEKLVLARAIWLHVQHKILVHNNKTVVFD